MTFVVGDATHVKSKPLSGSLSSGETWVYDGTHLIPAANEAFKYVDVDGTVLDANDSADTLHVSGVSGIKFSPVSGNGPGMDGLLAEVSGLASGQIPSWSEISGMADGGSGIAVGASEMAVGASGIAVAAVTPDYVPPGLLYKDINEIFIPKGRYHKAGHRWNGRYQDLDRIAEHWDIDEDHSIQVDATYASGTSPGMIDGAKVNDSWYSVFLLGDTENDVIVLPFVRVHTVDFDATFSGKTTVTPASHNGGVTSENGFIVSDHAWNGYRLLKVNDNLIGSDPITVEESQSGTPARIVVHGDRVTFDPFLAAKDWLQLAPPAGVPSVYLGAVRIDASGSVSPLSAGAPGVPGNCPNGVIRYATVLEAENSFSLGDGLIQVVETDTFYRFEEAGASFQVDHSSVLDTTGGGDSRWVGVAGRFALAGVDFMGRIADGRMTVCPAYYQTGSDQAVALTSAQHAIASLIVPEVRFQVQAIARRVKSVTTEGNGTLEIRANSLKLEPNGQLNGSTTNVAPTMTSNNAPSPNVASIVTRNGAAPFDTNGAYRIFDGTSTGHSFLNRHVVFDEGPVVFKGAGKVGLPCTDHGCVPGDKLRISGTTNYNTYYVNVEAETTANEIVIVAPYVAETLNGAVFRVKPTEADPVYICLDLGSGNSLIVNKWRISGDTKACSLWGSNASSPVKHIDTDWTQIAAYSGMSDPGVSAFAEYSAVNSTAYRHYRWKITDGISTTIADVVCREMQLFAAEYSDAPGEVLTTIGSLPSGGLANWNILSAGTPHTLTPGQKYWITETGEESKDYSVSTRRSNAVTGSAHPGGMLSKHSTDGGATWSQCLQDCLPALWNMIVNPADPEGDGTKPVPQLCYGAPAAGNRVYIPGSGLIAIPEEAVFLDLSGHEAPEPEFGYHVWLSHSGGALHLTATKDDKETTSGIVHKSGAPGFRWVGDVYPVQCQPGQYGPVDVMDRRLISYPGMKRILGKPNPYHMVTSQTILGSYWREYDESTDSWRIEFLACETCDLTLTACCRLAAAGNYAVPSIGIDGKLPTSEASAVQGVATHALLNSNLTITLAPGFHFAYPLVRGKGASCTVQYYGSEVDNREAFFAGELQC